MRLAIVLPNTLYWDGENYYSDNTQYSRLLRLCQSVDEVEVISFVTAGRLSAERRLVDGDRVKIVPLSVHVANSGVGLYLAQFGSWAPQLMRVLWDGRHRWDIVLLHDLLLPSQLAYLLCRMLRIPTALMLRGQNARSFVWAHDRAPLTKRLAARMFSTWLRLFEAHLVRHIPVTADYPPAEAVRKARLFVPLTGSLIEQSEIRSARDDSHRYAPWHLLTVGRVVPIKGHDVLIEAVAHLRHRGVPVHLSVVGRTYGSAYGSYHQSLVEQARRLGVDDAVDFEGAEFDNRKMIERYDSADILVIPSRSEGTPRVAYEALARGLPIVSSRVGGLPWLLESGAGILCEPGDGRALADAIERALASRHELSGMSVEVMKEYTVEATAQRLGDFLNAAIRARRRSMRGRVQTSSVRESDASARVCVMTSAHASDDVRIYQKQCRSLSAAGWHVAMVVPHDQDETVDGVRILGVRRRVGRLQRFSLTAWDVYRRALSTKAVVYHFHDPDLLPIALLLRRKGLHAIYDAHEDLPATIRHKEWLPEVTRPAVCMAASALERQVARRMSAIVTVNDEIADRIRAVNSRTVVVANYPRLSEFENLDVERDPRLLVSFGGISAQRCTGEIVSAVASLASNVECRLLLAGPIDAESLLSDLSNFSDRIKYVGTLRRPEMVETLSRSAGSLVLFSAQSNHYIPGSNRLYESLAAGVPVIVSAFPRWQRLVDEHGVGLAADQTDPDDIARAIEVLLSDPAEAVQMGHRGRKLVEHIWCWEREEQKLLALYTDIIRPSSWSDSYPPSGRT